MIEPEMNKLIPWNIDAETKVFLGELSVHPKSLYSLTFKELGGMHKSPTIAVKEEDLSREVKAQNKFLNIKGAKGVKQPVRPDLADIEVALIHACEGTIPDEVLAHMFNVSVKKIASIRRSTAHLYNQYDTPLPQLPLVTITDTSRYWTEGELRETYGLEEEDLPKDFGQHYKDLLRRLERQSKELLLPVNRQICREEDLGERIPRGTSIPSEVPEEDDEDYSSLSSTIWSYVSREEGVSGLLLYKDREEDRLVSDIVEIEYTSSVDLRDTNSSPSNPKKKTRVVKHIHTKGGYNPPLVLPKAIIKLAVDVYNAYIKASITPPNLEQLVINLLSAPEFMSRELGVPIPPRSSLRSHCSNAKSRYIVDSPPLIYPKFNGSHPNFRGQPYNYGVICHHCNSFLSPDSRNSCEHMTIETFLSKANSIGLGTKYYRPLIYLYTTLEDTSELQYSLYYYTLDPSTQAITSIYTHNLLKFYTNFSLPIHRLPYEA